MSTKTDEKEFRFDGFKWLIVVLLVAAGVYGNSFYGEYPILYRVLALVAIGLVAVVFAANTAKGDAFWSLLKDAQMEVRKVVWPTKQETHQTTLIVMVIVLIAALILWGMDTFLGWLASLIIG